MTQISKVGGGAGVETMQKTEAQEASQSPAVKPKQYHADSGKIVATVIGVAGDIKLGFFKRYDDAKYDALADEVNREPIMVAAFGEMFADFRPAVSGYVEGAAIRDIVESTGISLQEIRRATEFLRAMCARGTQAEVLQHVDYAAGVARYLLDHSMLGKAMEMFNNVKNKTVNVEFPKFGYSFRDHNPNFLDLLAQTSALISIDVLSGSLAEAGVDPAKIAFSTGTLAEFLDTKDDLVAGKYLALYSENSRYPNVISGVGDSTFLVMPFLGDTFDEFLNGYNHKYGSSNVCILAHELFHVFQAKKPHRMSNSEHEAEAHVLSSISEEVFGTRAGAARHESVADKPVDAEGYSELLSFLTMLFASKSRDAVKKYLFDDKSNYQKSAREWARAAIAAAKEGTTVSQEMKYALRPVALNYFLYPAKGMPAFSNPINDPKNVASAYSLRDGLLDVAKAAAFSKEKALDAMKKVAAGGSFIFPVAPKKVYRLSQNRRELDEFNKVLDGMAAKVIEDMRLIYLNTTNYDDSVSADNNTAYIRTLSFMFIYCGALAGVSEKDAFKYFEDKILPFAALKSALRMRSRQQEGK